MELVGRYLKAVRFWLAKARPEDIVAELSEGIRSQIEEKEGELGRKLNEAEVEAVLQRWGNPMLAARTISAAAAIDRTVVSRILADAETRSGNYGGDPRKRVSRGACQRRS